MNKLENYINRLRFNQSEPVSFEMHNMIGSMLMQDSQIYNSDLPKMALLDSELIDPLP